MAGVIRVLNNMLNKSIKLIHRFRVYFLVFISIAFLFIIGLSPVDISKFVGSEWSRAVGMNVGVVENPFNKLALELKQKEASLNEREKELSAMERDLLMPDKKQDIMIMVMGAGILVLLVLIMANYYLDYKRRQETKNN